MDTKQKIRKASIKLFNKSGVPEITTRHIAASINISQGNLHYHYPNKDVLLLTLYDEFISKSLELEQHNSSSMPIEDMIGSIKDNFQLMYDYRFLFIDREYIWRRVPLIETNYKKLLERKRMEINENVSHYIEDGTFRKDITSSQIEAFIDHLELLLTSWVYLIPFKPELNPKEYSNYFSQLTYRLWLPYLSPEKTDLWESAIKKAE